MDDSEIIAAFRQTNDPQCFQQLLDKYQVRVFRLVISVIGIQHESDAEDVAQEVFIRVYQKLPDFRQESQFSTWLYRIAYNFALDFRRSARYRYVHMTEDVLVNQSAAPATITHLLEQQEQSSIIQTCMERLPDVYRSVLYLFYWLNCSTDEIGEFLSVPSGTVKSYLHRGRKKLHHELKRMGFHHVEQL